MYFLLLILSINFSRLLHFFLRLKTTFGSAATVRNTLTLNVATHRAVSLLLTSLSVEGVVRLRTARAELCVENCDLKAAGVKVGEEIGGYSRKSLARGSGRPHTVLPVPDIRAAAVGGRCAARPRVYVARHATPRGCRFISSDESWLSVPTSAAWVKKGDAPRLGGSRSFYSSYWLWPGTTGRNRIREVLSLALMRRFVKISRNCFINCAYYRHYSSIACIRVFLLLSIRNR